MVLRLSLVEQQNPWGYMYSDSVWLVVTNCFLSSKYDLNHLKVIPLMPLCSIL